MSAATSGARPGLIAALGGGLLWILGAVAQSWSELATPLIADRAARGSRSHWVQDEPWREIRVPVQCQRHTPDMTSPLDPIASLANWHSSAARRESVINVTPRARRNGERRIGPVGGRDGYGNAHLLGVVAACRRADTGLHPTEESDRMAQDQPAEREHRDLDARQGGERSEAPIRASGDRRGAGRCIRHEQRADEERRWTPPTLRSVSRATRSFCSPGM
jgi:hypothetical protein